jgi:hypothetical protein
VVLRVGSARLMAVYKLMSNHKYYLYCGTKPLVTTPSNTNLYAEPSYYATDPINGRKYTVWQIME